MNLPNFLSLDINKIGIFNSFDMAYKIFDKSDLFCIKCNKNKTCTGNYNYSLGLI